MTDDDVTAARTSGQAPEDEFADAIARVFGVGLLVLAIGSAVPAVRTFFFAHWQVLTGIGAVIVVIVISYGPVRRAIQRNVRTKVGAVVISLAFLVVAEAGIGLLPSRYQILALRSVFVFSVCLVPGILYYLFITTRRDSLLNEFLTNLLRLGVLSPAPHEDPSEFRLRVLTYVQKFEAAYGPIDVAIADALLTEPASNIDAVVAAATRARRAGRSLASIFTPEAATPLVVCTILMALGWTVSLPPWHDVLPPAPLTDQPVEWAKALYPDRSAVYFAFLGAYFFGIQMLFRRYMLKDLRANAYIAISIRIVLAVVGTWVIVEAVRAIEGSGVTVDDPKILIPSFVVGVFPPIVWQFLQASFKKVTSVGVLLPSVDAKLPLSELDGLTIWHESRLQEEDIENVPNMATASIVDLMLNTRFSPNRIIDWVDQAILYTHLGAEQDDQKIAQFRATLREHGIRTASALVAVYKWAENRDALDDRLSPMGHPTVRTLVQALQTNRNLQLINRWRGLSDLEWSAVAVPALTVSALG